MKKTIRVSLWNRPFNGGWIWFDRKQAKRFSSGWSYPTLWWCFGGFCGRITLQTWPWEKFTPRHHRGPNHDNQ